MKSSIADRLQAGLRFEAYNGDSHERAIFAAQAGEAVKQLREYEKNAKLIAAAPRMYEALKAVDEYLSAPYPENMKLKAIACELVEQAINEATS